MSQLAYITHPMSWKVKHYMHDFQLIGMVTLNL